jgi:hypothetical protein
MTREPNKNPAASIRAKLLSLSRALQYAEGEKLVLTAGEVVHLQIKGNAFLRLLQQDIPNLPRFACADRPLAASASLRWGDPSPCALLPPPRQVAFGMYMPRFNADVQRPTPKEEAPMNTTSSITPISESPKQPQQRQTAKDIIAANVKSLIEQLEAGHSDALTAYLDAMS